MDEGLRKAAQYGNTDVLYALIKDDADVFERIDQMGFVDTPLHVAAAAGHTEFAMEIMNLKPSFARKLNQEGFSPIHLALQKEQTEVVVGLLSVDKDLVRVKGRDGYTPLHYVAKEGNIHLLSQFLDHCPLCMLDLTIGRETALHIAAQNNRFEAFKTILKWIQQTTEVSQLQRRRFLNLQDKDGNTVLHIAASNNQHQMIKLLMKCEEVDRNKTNRRGFTALHVLQQQPLVKMSESCLESMEILNRAPWRFPTMSEKKLTDYIKEMKPDTINALLVVFALILTITYQAVLSPPAAVSQVTDAPNSVKYHYLRSVIINTYGCRQAIVSPPFVVSQDDAQPPSDKNPDKEKSIENPYGFLWFYIRNGIAFFIAWFVTLAMLGVVAKRIMYFMYPLYFLMCVCYGAAMVMIAPSGMIAYVAVSVGSFLENMSYGPIAHLGLEILNVSDNPSLPPTHRRRARDPFYYIKVMFGCILEQEILEFYS
ncbi:hypothetical protein PTKIN_Ptkin16aG0495000 [Pterospermum kingtungense]